MAFIKNLWMTVHGQGAPGVARWAAVGRAWGDWVGDWGIQVSSKTAKPSDGAHACVWERESVIKLSFMLDNY